MHPETLIQKLFAIERAIGNAPAAQLRAMVVEAQEAALRMELDNMHGIDELRRRLESRSPAVSGEPSSVESSSLPRIA